VQINGTPFFVVERGKEIRSCGKLMVERELKVLFK
jgi:hypothetical protein